MPWELNANQPIYLQLIEHVKLDIITGKYHPGDKLPSVRDLAAEAAVNPNTMQKALSELERSGLVFAHRTSGRFITEDTALIANIKSALARLQVSEFVAKMRRLNLSTQEIITLIQSITEEANEQ